MNVVATVMNPVTATAVKSAILGSMTACQQAHQRLLARQELMQISCYSKLVSISYTYDAEVAIHNCR